MTFSASESYVELTCEMSGFQYEQISGGRAAAIAESIDVTERVEPADTVMNAAKLAVYALMITRIEKPMKI